jgi:hypothetical protein
MKMKSVDVGADFSTHIVDRDGVNVSVTLAEASGLSIAFHGRSIVLDAIAAKSLRRALDLFLVGSHPPLSRFIALCLRAAPGGRVQATALFRVYLAWAKASGEQGMTQNMFGRAMRAHGFFNRTSCVNYWIDVELARSAEDFARRKPFNAAPAPITPPPMTSPASAGKAATR